MGTHGFLVERCREASVMEYHPLSILPTELWYHIFSFLGANKCMLPFIATTCSTFMEMLPRRYYNDVSVEIKQSATCAYRQLLVDRLSRKGWLPLVLFAIEWYGCEPPTEESLPEEPDTKEAWDTFEYIVDSTARKNGEDSEGVTKVIQAFERRILDRDRPDLINRLREQYPGRTYPKDEALKLCTAYHNAPKCTPLYVSLFGGESHLCSVSVHDACMRTGSRKLLRLAAELEKERLKRHGHPLEWTGPTCTMHSIAENGSVKLAEECLRVYPELEKIGDDEETRTLLLPSAFGSIEMLRWYVARGWLRRGDRLRCNVLVRCVATCGF